MRRMILALSLAFPLTAFAAPAVKIPPLKLCLNNFTGAIIAKKACIKGETTITGQALQAFAPVGAQGPQGPQGAQGPAGVAGPKGGFDWTKCTIRFSTKSGNGYLGTALTCASGEFLMTHGVSATNINAVDSTQLFYDSSGKVAIGVTYLTFNPYDNTAFNTITVSGACCVP